MRRVTNEAVPASDGALLQFFLAADYFEIAAFVAFIDWQSQTPIAFLADEPVVHVLEPI